VEMEARVAFEPCLDLGMLVGCVVVHRTRDSVVMPQTRINASLGESFC
jgi:hypothetical protein